VVLALLAAMPASPVSAQSRGEAGAPPLPEVLVRVEPALHNKALPFQPTMVSAQFSVPLAQGWAVGEIDERPALGIEGADVWAYRTLESWPDGSVRWALAEVMVAAGQGMPPTTLRVTKGTGQSAAIPIARKKGQRIELDTGPLRATVSVDDFDLFRTVAVDGVQLVLNDDNQGIVAQATNGMSLRVGKQTKVSISRNDPVRAVVEAVGTLEAPGGLGLVDFTCRMDFVRGSRDVEVTFTIRNASKQRPGHVMLESVDLSTQLIVGPAPVARFALPSGSIQATLTPGERAWAYQSRSSASTAGTNGDTPNYLPHLPKLGPTTYVQEGYRVERDGVPLWSGPKTSYPQSAWADLSSGNGGVTVAIRDMAYLWPAALEVSGSGEVTAGIFTRHNPAPYTWVWRQHESRTAVFSFHAGQPVAPEDVARRLDAPVVGRLLDYRIYDVTRALGPYDLVTVAEQQTAYALMGIPHTVKATNPELMVTRFLPAGLGGGSNNHDSIQRQLGVEFLRFGTGGAWRSAMDLALYKAEWQILRSDDFDHAFDHGAINPQWPHSKAFASDDEHRYREGIALAWRLSGDQRLYDALVDEAEILPHVDLWPHERSMYQTLRALAAVADVTPSGNKLNQDLKKRLAYFTTPTVDVDTQPGGTGWEASPGQGPRGYYVHHTQHVSEKPAGEDYVSRGFITASLGPTALFLAARRLGDTQPDALRAHLRLRDLARYTRGELFPWFANPADRHLVYSYGVKQKSVNQWETVDFHPIQLGLAEAWRQTGDTSYLQKAVEQVEAFSAHGSLAALDSRVEFLHFCRALLDATGVAPGGN
jgi:hypothetical protein